MSDWHGKYCDKTINSSHPNRRIPSPKDKKQLEDKAGSAESFRLRNTFRTRKVSCFIRETFVDSGGASRLTWTPIRQKAGGTARPGEGRKERGELERKWGDGVTRELAGMMLFLKITINGESAKKQSCRHNPQKKIFIGSHHFSLFMFR